ncbi:MAG: carboxypeptidase regulatory-like domain-containing protein, partial [Gemmatimonadaceae bacterium]
MQHHRTYALLSLRLASASCLTTPLVAATCPSTAAPSVAPSIAGHVRHADARPAAGVLMVAQHLERPLRFATLTAASGSFELADAPDGRYAVSAAHEASDTALLTVTRGTASRADVTLRGTPNNAAVSSAQWLGMLPDGEAKRKFILDCTGCHQLDTRHVVKDGQPRSQQQWIADVTRMLGFAGATTGFPVIAADRNALETAVWASAALAGTPRARSAPLPLDSAVATITEYDMPLAHDLPHDVAVDSSGRVVITGMFSHTMYTLDAATGRLTDVPVPVPNGGPRAVEIDATGNWWVLLGGAGQVARYDIRERQWRTWPIDMYPHSIGIAAGTGRAWFNGHFTRDPEVIAELDPVSGAITKHQLPPHLTLRSDGGPIPYELRFAPDGRVWISELQGNRLIGYEPRTRQSVTYYMPTSWSGPRRFEIAADGVLWIPAYASNQLVRLDPRSGLTKAFDLPMRDAAPYVVRIDHATGQMWIGTSAGDVLMRFDPKTERFAVFPLPSRGALVRHLAIDPRTHDVWLAYGASPSSIPARIARVQLR